MTHPFPKRRAQLRGSDSQVVEKIEDARYVRIWLEDGTEIDVELFQRHGRPLLNVRGITDPIMVVPDASNTVYIGKYIDSSNLVRPVRTKKARAK